MVCMDKENRTPAYLCGRLLSVLERIQKEAIDPGATIIDRFYGGASTMPGRIFPSLVHKAQHHLRQLGNDKKKIKTYFGLQRDLDEILGNLCEFPLNLQLHDQGWFILEYYHQRAWDRAQRKAGKEEKVTEKEMVDEETPTNDEE